MLFIDEIHRLCHAVEEILYPAMEDFALDVVLGKGPGARTVRLQIEHVTVIGATTRVGSITGPLRDRFGVTYRLDYYTEEDLERILRRSAHDPRRGPRPTMRRGSSPAAVRGTPRIANRLLKRVRDFAQVRGSGDGVVTPELATDALDLLEIDERGLDALDRQLLRAMAEHHGGGPVGLQTMAATISEPVETIEDVVEPYLMQIGLLARTSRGRQLTPGGLASTWASTRRGSARRAAAGALRLGRCPRSSAASSWSIGIVLVVVGGLAMMGVRLPFGRLPGDIAITGEHGAIFIPLGTMLVISLDPEPPLQLLPAPLTDDRRTSAHRARKGSRARDGRSRIRRGRSPTDRRGDGSEGAEEAVQTVESCVQVERTGDERRHRDSGRRHHIHGDGLHHRREPGDHRRTAGTRPGRGSRRHRTGRRGHDDR